MLPGAPVAWNQPLTPHSAATVRNRPEPPSSIRIGSDFSTSAKPSATLTRPTASRPADMKRRMFARSARKPLISLPAAYAISRADPMTPIWVADRMSSSSMGFLTTEKFSRQM